MALHGGQGSVLTGRPRKATSRSMAGACSATVWAGPKRPGRAWSGQLGTDEGQRLVGQIIRQLAGLSRGLSEVPAVGEEVVETDLQSLGSGGRPDRAVIAAFENSRLVERCMQRGCGIAV